MAEGGQFLQSGFEEWDYGIDFSENGKCFIALEHPLAF